MSSPRRFAPLCCFRRERAHASEVVGRLRQQEQLLDSLMAPIHCTPNSTDCLVPAKHLLDAFALALTDGITRPACRASVNRRATDTASVLRHMRYHSIGAARRNEACRVVVLVRAHRNRHAGKPRRIREHVGRCIALGRTTGLRYLRVQHQAMPVVRQQVLDVAEQRAGTAALAKQLCLVVDAQFMRLVAAFLAVPVLARASAAVGRRIVVRILLAHEALVFRPRLNQRAVHTEMLARQVATRMRRLHRLVEQIHDDAVRSKRSRFLLNVEWSFTPPPRMTMARGFQQSASLTVSINSCRYRNFFVHGVRNDGLGGVIRGVSGTFV